MIWLLVDSSSVGGIERHVSILGQSLERAGIASRIVLYARHGKNPWLDQLHDAGLDPLILGNTVSSLYTAMRRDRPTLVHTHGYKAGVLGRPVALACGIPTVSTFHSGERGEFPVNVYFALDRWTSFPAHRISVSEAIKAKLPYPSTWAPSYVFTPPPAPRTALPRRVGFIGRLSPEKGPDLFCELARRSPPGIEWHVYGDGHMRADLERRYGECVRFHGVVRDVGAALETLGLVAMTSRFEGLPLVALESLSAGVPVLASRVGGVPTAVVDGRTGWLFEAEDLDGATKGLERWLALDEAAQVDLRSACVEHVTNEFSERRWLPEILSVYARAGFALPRPAPHIVQA